METTWMVPLLLICAFVAPVLDGRLAYVSLVLRNGDQEAIDNWLSKVELQRVPFSDLGRDHPAATLTENEGAQVRSAVRALAELDRAIDHLIANPDRYEASHAAGIYKQRATKARIML